MRRQKNQLIRPKSLQQVRHGKTVEDRFSGDFERDFAAMQEAVADSVDMKANIIRTRDHRRVGLFHYAPMVNHNLLSRNIIAPLQSIEGPLYPDVVKQRVLAVPETDITECISAAADSMSDGVVVLILEGQEAAILVHILQVAQRPVERAQSEDVIIGPHDSFTESLANNIALMRRLLATSKLKVLVLEVGRLSRSKINILYIQGITQEKLVQEVRERLQRIDIDHAEGVAYLADFLEDDPKTVFPLLRVTERPHRVAGALAEGRVAVLGNGDPTALIVPSFLPEYVQSSEDYFERPLVGSFLRWLRIISSFLAVFLPGLWIALVSFHHGIIPRPLFNSIVTGRENVPLPTMLEAFLLLLAFDIVIEASTRLPNAVGQAIGIVGAIILGQSAVQANLVSPAMTIVVALAGLATYTTPSPALISPMRILKYLVLIASSILGLYGIVWITIILILHLTSLRSFGYPYLFPVAPFNLQGMLDIVARLPLYRLTKRPHSLAAENNRRMADNLAPAPGKEPKDEK